MAEQVVLTSAATSDGLQRAGHRSIRRNFIDCPNLDSFETQVRKKAPPRACVQKAPLSGAKQHNNRSRRQHIFRLFQQASAF
jgi:hypothetical protein